VVLYEMLAGRRPFQGETVSDTLAAVLKEEPDLGRIPAVARKLVARCLEKDPRLRLRDIGDTLPLLEDPPHVAASPRPLIAWTGWGIAAGMAAILATVHLAQKPTASAEPMRFEVALPEQVKGFEATDVPVPVVSPDGQKLAFRAVGANGSYQLWVRDLNSLEAKLMPAADLDDLAAPFWSPDGRYLGFAGGRKLKKIDVSSGVAQTLGDLPPAVGTRGSWSRDGAILLSSAPGAGGIIRFSPDGAIATITSLDPSRKETWHWSPRFLPDSKHFLYASLSSVAQNEGIYLGSIDIPAERQLRVRLLGADAKLGGYVRWTNHQKPDLLFRRFSGRPAGGERITNGAGAQRFGAGNAQFPLPEGHQQKRRFVQPTHQRFRCDVAILS
jgi:serine/threonine-protein kinase